MSTKLYNDIALVRAYVEVYCSLLSSCPVMPDVRERVLCAVSSSNKGRFNAIPAFLMPLQCMSAARLERFQFVGI